MTPCGLTKIPEDRSASVIRLLLYTASRPGRQQYTVTAMRTYKFQGLCLDMSIQLQAVIIGRGWNERKMRADKKEEMKTRKNGQQQVEFRGRAL
jgi:predicted aminopeptidase